MGHRILFILLFSLASVLIAAAQEGSPTCDPSAPLNVLRGLTKALSANDTEKALNLALEAQRAIASFQAACANLHFTGTGDAVIGPLTIPTGIYHASLSTTEGLAHVAFTVLDGDCTLFPSLFVGEENTIDEQVFDFEDCETILEVSGRGSWTLDFALMARRE